MEKQNTTKQNNTTTTKAEKQALELFKKRFAHDLKDGKVLDHAQPYFNEWVNRLKSEDPLCYMDSETEQAYKEVLAEEREPLNCGTCFKACNTDHVCEVKTVTGTMSKADIIDKLLDNVIVTSMQTEQQLKAKTKSQLFNILYTVAKANKELKEVLEE